MIIILLIDDRGSKEGQLPSDGGKTLQSVSHSHHFRLNLTFASKKVFTDFLLTSFLIIVVPILFVAIANSYVKGNPDLTELMKVGIVIGPTIIYMNIVIGIYIYRAIKDPENYKVDPPIKIKPKK